MEEYRINTGRQELLIPTGSGAEAKLLRKSCGERDVLYLDVPYLGAYGMGERYSGVNQKGKRVVNQVVEQFCHQGEHTYLTAPFFVTDSGLGIYIDTKKKTTFVFEEIIQCEIPKEAEIVVFTGTIKEIIAAYMNLFGPAVLPPKYSFGIWISANHWNRQAAVDEQLELLAKHDFPASVLVLEAWSDEATFYIWNGAKYEPLDQEKPIRYEDFDFSESDYWQDPKAMAEKLHEKGIHLVLWQIPVYKEQSPDEEMNEQLSRDKEYVRQNRLCVHHTDGSPYRIPDGNWFAGSMIPDFTNPNTRKSWFDKRQYLLDMGVDGFKTDGGEFIYRDDLKFCDGMDGSEAKNAYAQTYTGAYTEFLGEEHVLFSRAGFVGAHRTPIHWGGDQQSENCELKSVFTAGLCAAMTGIPFWSFDLAGFAGPLPTLDLYRRATQLACFVPVMQWHSEPDGGQFKELMPGMEGNNERSPWNMAKAWNAPEFIEEMRFWHKLRMNLTPYLYSTAIAFTRDSMPMMYPLVYEWQQAEAIETEDEFMLGSSLLVAPLLEENQSVRRVWLPEGNWYQLFTHKKYKGGVAAMSDAGEKFPVYIREGRAVALRGSAREGLDVCRESESFRNGDYHFLLAGENGSDCFEDEIHRIMICWKRNSVIISGAEGIRVTWEHIR